MTKSTGVGRGRGRKPGLALVRRSAKEIANKVAPGTCARSRTARRRWTENVASTAAETVFEKYAAAEPLTQADVAAYNESREPHIWKCVIAHSKYSGLRTLKKDAFFFDRFPDVVTPETAVGPALRYVVDGTTVAEVNVCDDLSRFERLHRATSTVVFTEAERRHPFNFWEQWSRCHFCGADRMRILPRSSCCHGGTFLFNELCVLEPEQTSLARAGASKSSRNLNNVNAFAAFCLPRGGQRFPEDAQSLRIHGHCWRKLKHKEELFEDSVTFFQDPEDTLAMLQLHGSSRVTMPRAEHIRAYNDMISRVSRFAAALVNFGSLPVASVSRDGRTVALQSDGRRRFDADAARRRENEEHAFLSLEFEGTTTTLRAFSTRPRGAMVTARRVVFSTGNDTYTRVPLLLSLFYACTLPLQLLIAAPPSHLPYLGVRRPASARATKLKLLLTFTFTPRAGPPAL